MVSRLSCTYVSYRSFHANAGKGNLFYDDDAL